MMQFQRSLFHVPYHLLLSLIAGEYKQMILENRTLRPALQLYHEFFCGVSSFKDGQIKKKTPWP